MRGVPGAGPAVSRSLAYVPMMDGMIVAYHLETATTSSQETGKDVPAPTAAAADGSSQHETARMQQESKPPLICQSWGRAYVQPLVTTQTQGKEYIVWPTDRGNLELGEIDHQKDNVLSVKFELRTDGDIVAQSGLRVAGSADRARFGRHFCALERRFRVCRRGKELCHLVAIFGRRPDRGITRADR